MTEASARKVADAVIAIAAVGAAIVILRSPKLRRLALQLARDSAGPLAAWTATTVRQAWDESGTRRMMS